MYFLKDAKCAMKGLQLSRNKDLQTEKAFMDALLNIEPEDGESGMGVNKGFRRHEGMMKTYELTRSGLNAFHIKSFVCNKGIFCYHDKDFEISFPDGNWPFENTFPLP